MNGASTTYHRTMAWSTADIPDLTGKVAVVTGANGGLGLEVARELGRKGALVVMASRDRAKTEEARASILAENPNASLEPVPLDLGSLASVRQAAATIRAAHPRIDILVDKAGVMGVSERRTEDGFEMQLGVNHLGHFALTALLLPALLESGDARVVSVTSTGRHTGRPIDPDNPHLEGRYDPWRAYGQSKLANVHFALELDRRFRAARRAREEHRRTPRVRELGPAGPERARVRRRPEPAVLPERRRPCRDVSGPRCARAAPRGDRSEGRRRRPLHAAMGELRAAGAPAAVRTIEEPEGDDLALGGLRTRDRDHLRRAAALIPAQAPCVTAILDTPQAALAGSILWLLRKTFSGS